MKHIALGLVVLGLVLDYMDPGTNTGFWAVDNSLPGGIEIGTAVAVAGGLLFAYHAYKG